MIGTMIWMKMMIILVLVIKIAREDDTNNKDNDTGPPIPGGPWPPTFFQSNVFFLNMCCFVMFYVMFFCLEVAFLAILAV